MEKTAEEKWGKEARNEAFKRKLQYPILSQSWAVGFEVGAEYSRNAFKQALKEAIEKRAGEFLITEAAKDHYPFTKKEILDFIDHVEPKE